ncbi:hypothetical protein ACP70R_041863 [Stipagrostis hirtigluma subsp. patula]
MSTVLKAQHSTSGYCLNSDCYSTTAENCSTRLRLLYWLLLRSSALPFCHVFRPSSPTAVASRLFSWAPCATVRREERRGHRGEVGGRRRRRQHARAHDGQQRRPQRTCSGQRRRPPARAHDGQHSTLAKLGFAALACNSLLVIYNSWGDAGSVAFVLAADAALLLLFLCLRAFERARGGEAGTKIKAAVWALTALLTAMFASKVAPLMPPAVATLVWAMAVATAAGGFWAFFLN